MKYLRWLLFPFSLLYGLVVMIRNWCYDAGFFKSYKFSKPVISIGNLEVGGAGKSPMTEYLIRLLKDDYKIATLSRGYGRKTKGFLIAGIPNQEQRIKSGDLNEGFSPGVSASNCQPPTANCLGDEPAQFKQKFPDITVAVCEDRVFGLNQLMPGHDLVLMDDAYQHRPVEPGLSILLFDYNRIFEPHLLLPAGNMREPMSGRWRAQVIIVSKCPQGLAVAEQERIAAKVPPLPYQQLYFTSIAYQGLHDMDGLATDLVIDNDYTVFLLTGIANANPLVQHIRGFTGSIIHHNYPDHHPFTLKNIVKLADEFKACASEKKLFITTEKDAQRLEEFRNELQQLPVYVIPIRVEFLNDSQQQFNGLIFDYVRAHSTHHSIH